MSGETIVILIAVIWIGYLVYRDYHSKNGGGSQSAPHSQRTTQVRTPSMASQGRNYPLVPASRDNITETGMMVYFANDRHGRSDREYRFNYKKVGGGWRAYILRMPSLGNRDSSGAVTHRLYDGSGYYICWDRQVNSLKDMQTISRRWADSIQEYISTGRFG